MAPQKKNGSSSIGKKQQQPARFGIQHFFAKHMSQTQTTQGTQTADPPARNADTKQESNSNPIFAVPKFPVPSSNPSSTEPSPTELQQCTPKVDHKRDSACLDSKTGPQIRTEGSLKRQKKRMRFSPVMMLSQSQDDGTDEVVWKASPTAERLLATTGKTIKTDQRLALHPCQNKGNQSMNKAPALQGVCDLVSSQSKISPGIAGKLEQWLLPTNVGYDEAAKGGRVCNKENAGAVCQKPVKDNKSLPSNKAIQRFQPKSRSRTQTDKSHPKEDFGEGKLGAHRKVLLDLLDKVQTAISEENSAQQSLHLSVEEVQRFAQDNARDLAESSEVHSKLACYVNPLEETIKSFRHDDHDVVKAGLNNIKFGIDVQTESSLQFSRKSNQLDAEAIVHVQEECPNTPSVHFLVLEVADSDYLNSDCSIMLPQKTLRLLDEQTGAERLIYLRDEWFYTLVRPGDTVNVIGKFDMDGSCTIDHLKNLLVVNPDLLISGSKVGASFSCPRRAVLDERIKSPEFSFPALMGTMLHRLFQVAISTKNPTKEFLEHQAQIILQSHIDGLYAVEGNEQDAGAKLMASVPTILGWLKRFISPVDSEGPNVVCFGSSEGKQQVTVSEVVDIEEMVWSPTYGLKGMIDASVRVRQGRGHSECVMPLELKTGKGMSGQSAMEHRAQVILYTLLMSDRYTEDVKSGLLYYLHADQTQGVAVQHGDLSGLMMRRNEHASNILSASSMQVLPPMLQNFHACQGCRVVDICSVYHKAHEGGTAETSGLQSLFDTLTSHLSPKHAEFLRTWEHLIDLEAQVSQASQREIWRMPSWKREEQGRCLSSMVLELNEIQSGHQNNLNTYTFSRALPDRNGQPLGRKPRVSNSCLQDQPFTLGDYVILSTESGHVAVGAGYIKGINSTSIKISLSRPLRLPGSGHNKENESLLKEIWRIDKDDLGSSLAIMRYNLLQMFVKGGDDHCRRLVVDLEAPKFETGCSFTQDPASVYMRSVSSLNNDQRTAITKILAARDYALILGMPGTGKTSTIVHAVLALLARGSSVLLTSYTNSAVDNILLKLKVQGVDFVRVGRADSVHPELKENLLGFGLTSVEEMMVKVDRARVVASTCLGATHALFSKRKFDVCIVDEAGQITLPVCLGPLRAAHTFVLVGDHYQLPPLVRSAEAREKGMAVSLFRRLSEAHPEAVSALQCQYRMCAEIMNLSNVLIYGNRLQCGSSDVASAKLELTISKDFAPWLQQVLDPRHGVLFLDTDSVTIQDKQLQNAVTNFLEANLLLQVVHAMKAGGTCTNMLGVISPYKAQVDCIRRLAVNEGLSDLEVHTIDKYQGRDKDCILLSFVKSNTQGSSGALLADWHRINVAITRAKKKLVMIGSRNTLDRIPILHLLIKQVEEMGRLLRLPADALSTKMPLMRCTQLPKMRKEAIATQISVQRMQPIA